MPDFIAFTEGKNELMANGLPSTCYFLLSTKTCAVHTAGETLAGATLGEITGTGYARQSQSEPTPSGGTAVFSQMSFATSSATDWSNAVCSVVLATGAAGTGKAICAWNLQAGGTARDMSTANTTEQVTPTLVIA